MKILQVVPTLGCGGAEHFVIELTNELIRQGYDCDVLTFFDVAKDNDLLQLLNSKTKISSLGKKRGFDPKIYSRLYHFVKNGGYDVVHSHVGAIPYLLVSTLFLKNVKFIATIHSEAKREAGKSINRWNRFILFRRGLCTPVTISEASKASFDAYYKLDAPMVYNGVSNYNGECINTLKDNEKQFLFVHPASCQPIKNQELLIKAFARLTIDYPNSKMLWLGNNTMYMELYESLVPLMVKQFQYIGTVPNIRKYLVQADAMCLSSKMEGMPMTIIESFSVGTPALCTPVGGIVNMIDEGVNGMLSKSLSVDDYYNMMKEFCELTVSKKTRMRQKAKESFVKYSIANTAKGYLKVYGER